MNEDVSMASGHSQDSSAVPGAEAKKEFEAAKHDNIAYDTYRKAVNQKKRFQEENDFLKSQISDFEGQKLANEGRKDELISSLRKRAEESDAKAKRQEALYASNVVSEQIKRKAAERGCIKPDALIRLMDKDDWNAVEVDSTTLQVNSADLDRVVEKAMKDYEDIGLFKSNVNVKDMTPGVRMTEGAPDIESMSARELEDALLSGKI